MEENTEQNKEQNKEQGAEQESTAAIWILVDHSTREGAFEEVLAHLEESGVEAQLVTITEVLGTVARDALAGGAERLLRGLRVAIRGRGVDEDLLGALRRGKPRILAIANAGHARTLNVLENVAGIDSLHLGILSDYDLPTAWLNSSLQGFIVPHETHRERLVGVGMDAERVLVAGPPVRKGVESDLDRDAVRAELGLGDDFVVLVRGDGFDVSTLEKLVFQCTLADRPVRFIFHHNGDGATAQTLRRASDQYRLKAAMFGRVDDLERYLLAADGVIVSPKEEWIPETVALSRPLLIVGKDEARSFQTDFLVGQGVARAVPDVVRLDSELDRFTDAEARAAMEEAATELGTRTGSQAVADALKVALEHSEAWRQPAVSEPVGEEPPDVAPVDEEPKVKGPFETIGSGADRSREPREEPPGGGEAPRRRDYSGISQAEAKEQLAQLILLERDVERRLSEIERQQERWRNRLDLAREWNEDDLAREAESVLRGYLAEAESLQTELGDVRLQKEKLRQAARSGPEGRGDRPGGASAGQPGMDGERPSSHMESRFQKMEVDSDLKGLKDRIRRELGE
ncbi:MAG: hypothetical protein ACNA8W_02505 [Bradymonadaceae bacterium]